MRRNLHVVSCVSVLATLFAAPAMAQTSPSAGGGDASDRVATETEDIIVTARRRDERLLDVPVAITAISGKAMEAYKVSQVTDLAAQVPGLVAGKAASGSSASIFLRGVGSTALSAGFDQSVSFVIDGLPMSRGREISLPQFDVQRVEVLKGPQALFYGKNTTGGLISITTNGPTDYFEAALNTGYGFEARQAYVDGFVSGPIGDTVRARLAARYSDSEGPFKNSAADEYPSPVPGLFNTRNSKRRGGAETLGVRGTIDWKPNDVLTFEVKAGLSHVKDGGPTDLVERICGGGRTTPSPSVPAEGFVVPASPNTDCRINGVADSSAIPSEIAHADYRWARDGQMYADFKSESLILKSEANTDLFDVTSLTSYYHFNQKDANNVSGESYPGNFTQYADFEQFSQELRIQSKFDGSFNVLGGAFYSHGKFEFNTDAYIFPFQPPEGETYVSFKRDNGFVSNSLSGFLQGALTFGNFELAGGGRWSSEERTSYQRSLDANPVVVTDVGGGTFLPVFPGGIELNDKFRDTNLSPEVTLRYKPTPDIAFYAAYKQGFKTGGFNISQALSLPALFNPDSALEAGRFDSETAKGGEIGARAQLLGGTLSLNATAFRYEYTNLQVQVFDPQTVSLIADNAGKLVTQGVEADFNWRAAEPLVLRGAIAYTEAQYKDYIGACYEGQTIAGGCAYNLDPNTGAFRAQDYGGRTPPKAPKVAGRIGFTFTQPVGAGNVVLISDASYTGKYNFTDTLRPDAVQSAFWKFDAALRYNAPDDRWHISLIGRNLSNKLVATSANDIPFTGGTGTGTTSGYVADMSTFIENPREIFLEVGFRF